MDQKDTQNKILIVSVDAHLLSEIDRSECLKDFVLYRAKSNQDALRQFDKHSPDIVLLDIEHFQMQELDLCHYVKTNAPHVEIIILTTIHELENATYALHRGAALYLMKPIACSDLKLVVEKVSAKIERTAEYQEFEQRVLYEQVVGNPSMEKFLKLVMKIAPTSSTILVFGETGTGKEVWAKIIHRMSPRQDGKFVAVNCGAIPENLIESELFGYKKGAFTGADRDKPGLVEEAHLGTLFLDEVGELSLQAQVKLLRFLQEHTYHRVGDPTARSVDVRVIAATNRDLAVMIEQERFRQDLYYRLNVFTLFLPPLRERKETIPNLVRLFVQRNNLSMNKNISKISKGAEILIAEYDFPGNVRELENIIEHSMVLSDGLEITEHDLPEFMHKRRLRLPGPEKSTSEIPLQTSPEEMSLAEVEKEHIQRILSSTNNNFTDAAKRLGISRSTLWRKMREYHLDSL